MFLKTVSCWKNFIVGLVALAATVTKWNHEWILGVAKMNFMLCEFSSRKMNSQSGVYFRHSVLFSFVANLEQFQFTEGRETYSYGFPWWILPTGIVIKSYLEESNKAFRFLCRHRSLATNTIGIPFAKRTSHTRGLNPTHKHPFANHVACHRAVPSISAS